MGILSDYLSPYNLAAITIGASGLAVFLLWGLASTAYGPFLAFSAAFGLVAGGFSGLVTGFVKEFAGNDAFFSKAIHAIPKIAFGR